MVDAGGGKAAMGGGPLAALIRSHRVVVMLGAGGVGKTTTAVALALLGAANGRRVALLSIDPAKRLAAALGINLSGELTGVRLDGPLGRMAAGTLEAAMLDQKPVFDSMVRRHAPSPAVAARILAHPVYVAASTNLSGPLEYMALAKLQELAENPQYDLIILDTPPDSHALDFLARPNVLAGFMENRVMTWLVKPFQLAGKVGLGRIFSAGEKLMGGVAKVTGVSALHAFADFLVLVQDVIEGFHRTGERTVATLKRPDTAFVVVTTPTGASMRSATVLVRELSALGYRLAAGIVNRCLPAGVLKDLGDDGSARGRSDLSGLVARAESEGDLIARLARRLDQGAASPAILRLTDQDLDLGTPEGLAALVTELADAPRLASDQNGGRQV